MVTMLISFLVTLIFLIKMIFSDMAGSDTTIDAVKDGIKNAKEINDILKDTDEEPTKENPFKK